MDHVLALATALRSLAEGDESLARATIATEYPLGLVTRTPRVIPYAEALAVFIRDGFIDRYSADRLIFPGVFCRLSQACPEEFPYHPHWRTDRTHQAYWQLYPTIDHVVPITRGGPPDPQPSNWVTTSMLHNGAKGNATLDELGWTCRPPGRMEDWDGLLGLFRHYLDTHSEFAISSTLRRWQRALAVVRRNGLIS